jgi:hypothetical protein
MYFPGLRNLNDRSQYPILYNLVVSYQKGMIPRGKSTFGMKTVGRILLNAHP